MNQLTVKKSHELVTARFHFSLQEMRLFCMVVGMIDDRDEDFKTYRIPIQEVIKTFGIKSNTIYEELKKLTDSMLHKIIVIPLKENGKDKILKTTLMSSFKYNVDGRGVLEVTFHPTLKPYLLQVKNRYLLYDIQNILRIGSPNSIRMYELLKSFEGIGKRSFNLQELKEILGVADKYSKYSNFKRKILLKAQDDLAKHTDIVFTFEELSPSGGRKVEKLVFYISENRATKKKYPKDPILAEVEESSERSSIEKKLAGFGLSKLVIKNKILKEFEEDYIL